MITVSAMSRRVCGSDVVRIRSSSSVASRWSVVSSSTTSAPRVAWVTVASLTVVGGGRPGLGSYPKSRRSCFACRRHPSERVTPTNPLRVSDVKRKAGSHDRPGPRSTTTRGGPGRRPTRAGRDRRPAARRRPWRRLGLRPALRPARAARVRAGAPRAAGPGTGGGDGPGGARRGLAHREPVRLPAAAAGSRGCSPSRTAAPSTACGPSRPRRTGCRRSRQRRCTCPTTRSPTRSARGWSASRCATASTASPSCSGRRSRSRTTGATPTGRWRRCSTPPCPPSRPGCGTD